MSMPRIDGQTPIGGAYDLKVDTNTKKDEVGAGSLQQTGDVPPVSLASNAAANALKSLSSFMSGGATVDIEVLLVQVAVTMRDTEAKAQTSKINADQETKKTELKHKEAKLEEAAKKLEEAEEKRKSGNIFDKIKLAFQWIGAALAVALGAVLIATGAGAVVGALLIAAAVTSIIMAVDATVKDATGLGIAGNIAKASGASEETIAKADMGFAIGLAVLGVVLSIAAGGASTFSAIKGAVSAGVEAGQAASAAGQTAGTVVRTAINAAKAAFSEIMKEASQGISQAMRMARNVLEVSDATAQAGSAATDIASTSVKYEATNLDADAKKLQAQAKTSEALMQQLDDFIDQALHRLMQSGDRFQAILDDITQTMAEHGETMMKARFAG